VFSGEVRAGIPRRLWITEGMIGTRVRSILTKLNLPETGATAQASPRSPSSRPADGNSTPVRVLSVPLTATGRSR
jgi:hypothetical protein